LLLKSSFYRIITSSSLQITVEIPKILGFDIYIYLMPIIQSAIKKLRQDKKRNHINVAVRDALKAALKQARLTPKPETLRAAYSALDTASKKHVIHPNKAARLKSRLTKLQFKTQTKPTPVTP